MAVEKNTEPEENTEDTNEEKNAIKQCWICQSEGELKKYVQKDVDRFIYDFYFNNGMQER